jgi:hypothetical protein
MSSVVASTFRASVAAQLTEEQAELMKPARGSGPEHRETHRALMLGDRAAREWAATAVAAGQVGAPNEFESLPRLAKPEDAYHSLQPAAQRLRSGGASPEQRALGALLFDLSEALKDIDTEVSAAGNEAAFKAVATAGAGILIAASDLLGGEEFVVRQANTTLDDLVSLPEWENALGPRFE